MDDYRPCSRRKFLVMAGALLAGAGLSKACRPATMPTSTPTSTPSPTATSTSMRRPARAATSTSTGRPTPTPTSTPTSVPTPRGHGVARVVHVHDSAATNWGFSSGWYGDFVDQDVVYEMVDHGLMQLTGTTSRAAAWQALIPQYVPGQRVAVKVNLNNASGEHDSDNVIDALIQPVNAVIRGLKEIGLAESNIWMYDAVRSIPSRFRSRCDFSGAQFSGKWTNSQGFSDTERVSFQPPPGGPQLAAQRISNVLANADYLINMPIMKRHGGARVTLSFKNHFGSIENCAILHDYTYPSKDGYSPHYNPLVDIYKNPHFVTKTVLTIGDGLYGCWPTNWVEPEPWITFGNQAPNSLFFSRDPVSIDCVMYDFLDAEVGVESGGDDYLVLAAQEGLGVFEHRAPGASGPEEWYSFIDYVYLDGV